MRMFRALLIYLALCVPALAQSDNVTINGQVAISGTLTPTALAADQNDYNPAGLATATALRIDGGASNRNITGIAGGADGRLLTVINIGTTNLLVIKDESGSSAAANRMTLGSDVTLAVKKSLLLRYDGTTGRWRPWDSSALTGTTAAVDTSNTNLATNAYVLNQAASATPLADGVTAAVGTSTRFARADHVHPIPNLSPITNSLVGAVTMTTQNTYYDGPSVAQGSTGTWFASGTITVSAPATGNILAAKLWDGTTLIDSAGIQSGGSLIATLHLSGFLASPAGNLRISVTNATQNGGTIGTGNGIDAKASTISAFRIQ